ncbi:hypothetical protein PINS_up000764 [Pythium insidiosum]|nr:hypothetical protein PINS_up000764 [Pythium insidiosum]
MKWRRVLFAVLALHVLPRDDSPLDASIHRSTSSALAVKSLIVKAEASGRVVNVRPIDDIELANEDTDDDVLEFELDLDPPSKRKLQRQNAKRFNTKATKGEARSRFHASLQSDSNVEPSPSVQYGRGRGFTTTRPLLVGDELFSIPAEQVMSLQSARRGRVQALLEVNPDLPVAVTLALHLLEEKFLGSKSAFYPYIASLPSSTEMNSTLFYSEAELETLQGSHLARVTIGRLQALRSYFDALLGPVTSRAMTPPLFSRDEFTLEHFHWALGIVWARAFPLSDGEQDVVLAPMLDTVAVCVDASCPRRSHIDWDRHRGQLVAYATQAYAGGDEVKMWLGPRSSTLLMLNHGFSRPAPWSELESLDVSIFLDPNDTLLAVKSHVLAAYNRSINGTYELRLQRDVLDLGMHQSLKVKLMNGRELERYASVLSFEPPAKAPDARPIVSLRNEFVFCRAVLHACRNLLSQYPTTLDEDREVLEDLMRGRRREDCEQDRAVHMRRALVIEKEILHHTMSVVRQQWADLLLSNDETLFASLQ